MKGSVEWDIIALFMIPIVITVAVLAMSIYEGNTEVEMMKAKQQYQLDSLRLCDSIRTRSR